MSTNEMQVILGVASLKAYVTAPKSFHVLGIVRFGQEYGLLATNAEGLYFRVNGSQALALDRSAVDRAMSHAYGGPGRPLRPVSSRSPAPAGPHIAIRKHRQALPCALRT